MARYTIISIFLVIPFLLFSQQEKLTKRERQQYSIVFGIDYWLNKSNIWQKSGYHPITINNPISYHGGIQYRYLLGKRGRHFMALEAGLGANYNKSKFNINLDLLGYPGGGNVNYAITANRLYIYGLFKYGYTWKLPKQWSIAPTIGIRPMYFATGGDRHKYGLTWHSDTTTRIITTWRKDFSGGQYQYWYLYPTLQLGIEISRYLPRQKLYLRLGFTFEQLAWYNITWWGGEGGLSQNIYDFNHNPVGTYNYETTLRFFSLKLGVGF